MSESITFFQTLCNNYLYQDLSAILPLTLHTHAPGRAAERLAKQRVMCQAYIILCFAFL